MGNGIPLSTEQVKILQFQNQLVGLVQEVEVVSMKRNKGELRLVRVSYTASWHQPAGDTKNKNIYRELGRKEVVTEAAISLVSSVSISTHWHQTPRQSE